MVGFRILTPAIYVQIVFPQPLEVVTIRKFSVIFLCLVVITSLSFTAFAAGEQPSGSSYWYISGTGTTLYGTYWESVTKSLFYMGQDINTILGNLPSGSSYSYYNGSSRSGNYWTAVTSGLNYIGLQAYNIQGDTAAIRSDSSSTNNIVSDIKSSLPTTSTYSYTTNSGTINSGTYWTSTNNQLGYIQSRAGSILDKITSIDNKFIDYTTLLTYIKNYTQSIDSSAQSIDTSTQSIDTSTQSIDSSTQSIDTYTQSIYSRMPLSDKYFFWNQTTANRSDFWSALSISNRWTAQYLSYLAYMFASPEDRALKADQENNVSAATTNFMSGNDTATSVGTGSIGKIKDLGDGAASFFDTGVNATSLFTLLGDSSSDGPWTWFTQAVADDLDAVAAANRNSRSNSSSESVVDFYSDKMADLDKLLGSIEEVDNRKYENYVFTASDFQPDPDPVEVDIND